MRILPTILIVAGVSAIGAVAFAQARKAAEVPQPTQQKYGILNFETNVGSFKVLGTRDSNERDVPAEGTLTMSFDGTVLISGLNGNVSVTGNVTKEYENKERQRTVFFGRGTMTITGKWRAVQFFGRDLKGRHNGFGSFRFFGEFDRNLNTGWVWYEGEERMPWGTGGLNRANPNPLEAPKPRVAPPGGG